MSAQSLIAQRTRPAASAGFSTAGTASGADAIAAVAGGAGAGGAVSYAIHPGVAAAGRAQAGQAFRDAVDAAAAAYWDAVHLYASGDNDEHSVDTGLVVRAGLAGLGPWTQLSDEVRRLQVLAAMGQASQVLDEVGRLRARMDALPATLAAGGPDETVPPWSVREVLLDTGRSAARQLGRWQQALELNAAQVASLRDRRAPATDIALSRFNDYGPLLRLRRTGEALALLQDCRQVFQDAATAPGQAEAEDRA